MMNEEPLWEYADNSGHATRLARDYRIALLSWDLMDGLDHREWEHEFIRTCRLHCIDGFVIHVDHHQLTVAYRGRALDVTPEQILELLPLEPAPRRKRRRFIDWIRRQGPVEFDTNGVPVFHYGEGFRR